MNSDYLKIEQSLPLTGSVELSGAKNAVLVIMASLLLTKGVSTLHNVPSSADVKGMIAVLSHLGAYVIFDEIHHRLIVDTSSITNNTVSADFMQKMRASVLIMGSLLARVGTVMIGLPGGCSIGARPLDYHLKNFTKMGVSVSFEGDFLCAIAQKLESKRLVLEYPSVGATENILLLATRVSGITTIINAALEPEVLDLIIVLQKMGAKITIQAPATIIVEGVEELHPIEHTIMCDRLEAGSLLLAAAATGGSIYLPQACAFSLDVFLLKLEEMGHHITVGENGQGITFKATQSPRAVSFKTGPFPGFPTDLQSPMMALQCTALGTSVIEETVFENRFMHVDYLRMMGANIHVNHNKAVVTGVDKLYGAHVVATDIRASMALVVAGLSAQGITILSAIHHWKRGYDSLEKKLVALGASISLHEEKNEDFIKRSSAVQIDNLI